MSEKKKTEEANVTAEETPAETGTVDMNEKVRVKLPLSREKSRDAFVSLNGKNMKIRRGVEVEIPRWAYEILKNSEDMDMLALENQKKITKKFV